MTHKLYIASAGAGKTTLIVNKALRNDVPVLITTFTQQNELEIRKKFLELNNGIIPSYVTIQTWFSFLIEHGAKPYQGTHTTNKINGLILVNNPSATFRTKNGIRVIGEENIDKHYFSNDYKIYSDKLSKFVVKCNERSNGRVIGRISAIFPRIYIDEVQDMAGYDLEFIKLLLRTDSKVIMAGDPRQVTYHTHFSTMNKKYSNGKIAQFIEENCRDSDVLIDTNTLTGSWRCNQKICDLSNKLFPDLPQSFSLKNKTTGHDGIFLVRKKDILSYLEELSPLQLRYDRRTKSVNNNYDVLNFGESKGTTKNRTLIYPTEKIKNWLFQEKEIDSFETRCRLYVAITRARHSVGIVCENNTIEEIFPFYHPNLTTKNSLV